MQIDGFIKLIGETKEFGSNGFTKREFVITTEDQYPQHLQLELVKDKCSLLDKFVEGEQVTVSINLRGREWTNPQGEVKYFNTIQAWKIESRGAPPKPKTSQEDAFEPPVHQNNEEDFDDLPF